jgi:hypothetical protein
VTALRICATASASRFSAMSKPGPSHARAALSTCSASCATRHAPTARHEPLSVWANTAAQSADAARMPSTNIAHCRSNSRRTSASRFRLPKVMRARWARSITSGEARRAGAGACASPEFGGFSAALFAALVIACTSLMRCIASSIHRSQNSERPADLFPAGLPSSRSLELALSSTCDRFPKRRQGGTRKKHENRQLFRSLRRKSKETASQADSAAYRPQCVPKIREGKAR